VGLTSAWFGREEWGVRDLDCFTGGLSEVLFAQGFGTGKEFLQELAGGLSETLRGFLYELVGRSGDGEGETWVRAFIFLLFFFAVVLVQLITRYLFQRKKRAVEQSAAEGKASALVLALEAARAPVHLLLWVCGGYFALVSLTGSAALLDSVFDVGLFVALLWLFFRLTGVLDARLKAWSKGTQSATDDILLPLAVKSLRIILPVIAVVFALPMLGLPPAFQSIIYSASSLLIICAAAWVVVQGVFLFEKLILSRYDIEEADNLRARQIHTQVQVLKKVVLVIIAIVTISLVLMSFEQVRQLGTSILASAGVLGIIIGFAVQRMIANLFAGFQLAMTQPVRLDDVVIVENEWGWIEEITLTYVVVRIWDLRRLVLPISYFIERPFQNWTRVSADILGTVYLHTDYRIPVDAVRRELERVVAESDNWDEKVVGLVVTSAKEDTLELRALVSASDSGKAWDLRCEVREKLVDFIQREYPDCLPKVRASIGEEVRVGKAGGSKS